MIGLIAAALLMSSVASEADKVMSGDPNTMVQRFQTLAVEDRLKVYNYLYDKSGHPRDTRLASSFTDKPAETVSRVAADLPPKDFGRFMRYMPILYSIYTSKHFDICRAREIPALRKRLQSYRLSRDQTSALSSVQFTRCPIF